MTNKDKIITVMVGLIIGMAAMMCFENFLIALFAGFVVGILVGMVGLIWQMDPRFNMMGGFLALLGSALGAGAVWLCAILKGAVI